METGTNNNEIDKQIDPFEWMDRNSHILDEDLLEFIKLSPHENLGVFPPTDPRVLKFPCPNMVETFNHSLIRLKEKFHKSNESEHKVIFKEIIDSAGLCCGVDWARRLFVFLIQKKADK